MKNKEVMDKVTSYLLTQDPAVVARTCAALMVDINRIDMIESLPADEVECLFKRIALNSIELREFIEKGATKDFKIVRMNSSED